MPRQESRYICQACGTAHLRWEGQCRTCGEWNTLVETVVRESEARRRLPGPGMGPADRTASPHSLDAESVREVPAAVNT